MSVKVQDKAYGMVPNAEVDCGDFNFMPNASDPFQLGKSLSN